jgi:hypothetical protein
LLGATTAFGYAVARRRKRRPKQQVVVVDQGAKRNTVWGLLAGRALELATKIALNEVQNRLEDGGLIRTDAEVDSSDE